LSLFKLIKYEVLVFVEVDNLFNFNIILNKRDVQY